MADRRSTRSVAVVVLMICVVLAGCGAAPSDATTNETGSDRTTSTASPTRSTTGDGSSSDSATTGRAGTTRTTPVTNATSIAGTADEDEDEDEDEGEGENASSGGDTSRSALVTRVIDGDTVEVKYRDGESDRIRLLGVDTPEISGDVSPDEFEGVPDTEAGREHLREWATRASSFAREELEGREVEIVTDPRADRRDRYGRLLAYVVRSGEGGGDEASDRSENGSFNAALLRGGYARMYDSTFSERERYERIEASAQERGIGLWGFNIGNGDSETDTESASGPTSGLTIARIESNAPGDDNDDPSGEYVVFENRGSETLDLSGWQVSDEGGHTYLFP